MCRDHSTSNIPTTKFTEVSKPKGHLYLVSRLFIQSQASLLPCDPQHRP